MSLTQPERLTVLLCWGRRPSGEYSSYHADEIHVRRNLQTHKEQHLILYFEVKNGAQTPHNLPQVLPS